MTVSPDMPQMTPIADRLEHALGDGKLPPHMQDWGRQLLSHLRKPVQVVVMGLPGSGKSTLVNMLVGERVIPKTRPVPVIEIAGGTAPKVVFELEDGTMQRQAGLLDSVEIPAGAIRARQELPQAQLARQTFVEVDLRGSFGYQKSIVNWVVQWADIVLWATQDFDETEQELWSAVPDEIKDRSFLVLTMADQQLMRGTLMDRIAALEELVAEEFLGLYPIATIQAIAARSTGERANATLWKSSGGMELMSVVQRQIALGREADLDRAHMLLNRYAPETAVPRGARPAPRAPASGPDAAATGGASGTPDPRRTPPSPEPSAAAAKTAAQAATGSGAAPRPAQGQAIFGDALGLLQDRADRMFGALSRTDGENPDSVLQECLDAANALNDLFASADPADAALRALQEDAEESAEMMLLFQLEKGEDAAADAVTLLMQLKKDLAQRASG